MTDLVGKQFQGYRILGQVGPRGGANIFKATTPQGDEIVAIKFLSSQVGRNRQVVEKLRACFRSVIRLDHPSILPVMTFNIHAGYPYVVMPFMEAGSLEDRIEFGALGAINVMAVVREVASALEVVHSQGLVHGDLKPSNILFDEDGNVKLSGIGESPLARLRANQLRDEREGRTSYQAPEVLAGGAVTPACDQYSLGLIALEVLTRLPVDEAFNALEHIRRYGRDTVTRPSPYALDLTARMMNFISRSLSKNPAERFTSMQEWKRAFIAAYSNEPLPSEPETEVETVQVAQKKPRRNRLVLVAPILALILCLVVAVPALTSDGGGPLGGILASIGLLGEGSTSVEPASDDENSGGIRLDTSVPNDKDVSIEESTVKATAVLTTEDAPSSSGGASVVPTYTSVPAAKTDPPKQPAATQVPQDQATATITFTPTPTVSEEVTETTTETPINTPTYTGPAPTDIPSEPTINPKVCRTDPTKKNYCTPIP